MGKPGGNVVYMDIDELWNGYEDLLVDLANREGVKAVAELGGGANPIRPPPRNPHVCTHLPRADT